ncbi:hypothetical protein MUS1_12390 [Marinomonas ushuaiensis DSM 15871]|uniref:DUF4139 domain-containing protein n=1 Tax=Marinomonas ushuaiensis DSM 15871 TaxID=1122207 RepID=X7E542_9GAMM|nr:hypothetical protein [Marinomonas ushuaiensis]ETX11184.1 hypothetical protein MUS1_12390 [Marinomonas ushuaiensis DSM 15871]
MKTAHSFFCVSIILGATSSSILAAPINAVIGLSNSQVVESGKKMSLVPNTGTVLPLQDSFLPISNLQNTENKNWFDEIGQKIRVEHKQRDLSYTGVLTSIENGERSFLISVNKRLTSLPMSDFYLIPLEKNDSTKTTSVPYQVSYQTNQLSWTPQLSLIFDDNQVSLSQQAILHNNSSAVIEIQDSLLHYSRTASPQVFKAERSLMAMDSANQGVEYQDNEISYPLNGPVLSIAPYSNTLYSLPSSRSSIDSKVQTGSLYTHSNSTGKIDISFYNQLGFTLEQDGLPGEYKTFWKRNNLLIPGNSVALNTVRANNSVEVITNKSQDITGYITLVESSSKKLPSTQTWEATIQNHSNQEQNYSIVQNTNGIIQILEKSDVAQLNANSIEISGKIKANSKKTITYKIELNN